MSLRASLIMVFSPVATITNIHTPHTNVHSIPGACATRNFTYLVRSPCMTLLILDEVIPPLCIHATCAMVMGPSMVTINRSRYAQLGFKFYTLRLLSQAILPSKLAEFSQKMGHTLMNMHLRYHVIVVTFSYIISAVAVSVKICGHKFCQEYIYIYIYRCTGHSVTLAYWHIAPSHYHHYADLIDIIEHLNCL